MSNCIYCGSSVGFLKKSHKECKQQHLNGRSNILSLIDSSILEKGNLNRLQLSIEQVASSSYIDHLSIKPLLINGWENAVDVAFDDGILTEEEESALTEYMEFFSLSQNDLDENGAFTKIVKGAVLRDILEGKLPKRVNIDGQLPFNLLKTEQIMWLFTDVDYFEQKIRTNYVGGSHGVSIRIAKGLYYRTAAFKGERVQTSETIHADTGIMGITNKHIYFSGSSKSFRINFNKIVAFEPFSDGIGIQKDAQTAMPQSFSTGDGWFTYNLISNLAQMA